MPTVSLKEPLASVVMRDEPLVSKIGMEASRDRPTSVWGVKCEPCRVKMPPKAMLAGVACKVNEPVDGLVVGACPSETKMPKPPLNNKAMMKTMATQPARRGISGERGGHFFFLCGGDGSRAGASPASTR